MGMAPLALTYNIAIVVVYIAMSNLHAWHVNVHKRKR